MSLEILLVEDETIVARDIEQLLESLDHTVLDIVRTADRAVNRAKQLDPDLIFMDINLDGDRDGISATAAINEETDVDVCYLTAHYSNPILERARETSAVGYLTKPVTEEDLGEMIRHVTTGTDSSDSLDTPRGGLFTVETARRIIRGILSDSGGITSIPARELNASFAE